MKKILIPLVAVGVTLLILTAYLLWSIPPNTIVLRADGFHPRTLTVSVGTTVTFKNERTEYFWPASDFHPTHTLYPAFDAKEPLAPGATYSFTFTEAGTYPFHDHLAAYFSGILRVADDAGAVPDNCMERGGNFACWQNDIFLHLTEGGVDGAYTRVAELFAEDPSFATSCHSLAHNIGLASYQLYLEDADAIFSPKAVSCAAGFYHGFMEGLLGATGDVHKAAAVCNAIGEKLGTQSPDARYQCFHGIGHGAMETAVATTGIFSSVDEMTESALAVCEQASDGEEERYRCASGAYNAIANYYIIGAYGLTTTEGEAFKLCARQPDVYKESCYGNMNSVAMWLEHNAFLKASTHILSIADTAYIPKSIEYLSGMNALGHLYDTSFEGVISACHALPAAYRNACVTGFSHGLLEHGSPGKEYETSLTFCALTGLTASEKDACYQKALGTLTGWYSEEKSADICASVAPELQRYCAK